MKTTLLTQQACDLCDQAKGVLDRLRPEFGLQIELVDITTEQGRELAARSGVLFPPGLLIDGEPYSYGRVSERKLRKELARRTKTVR
jgi:glutaredoxin